MTVTDILNQVHNTYEGSTDYPEAGDEDFDIRFAILKDGLDVWISKNQNWRESYDTLENASDGDKTTSIGETEYDCPSDFIRPSSFVKVGSVYLSYLPPNQITNTTRINSSEAFFSITGSPGAYKLVINPAPTATEDIEYPYYRELATPTSGSSVLEINRPLFLKYYVLARLYEQDNRNDLVNFYETKMEEEEQMATVDLVRSPFGVLAKIKDAGNSIYGSGFGK